MQREKFEAMGKQQEALVKSTENDWMTCGKW